MTDRRVRSLLPSSLAHAVPRHDRYDGFLSYSRDSDGEFAPAFHAQLLEFDRRDDVPDLNVFLDRTGLANNPSLWDAIERKLERSDYLILFASEGAASSHYVAKEVAWWLDNREPETLLVALTSGKIVWDQTANKIDTISTTALPAPLAERLDHEPKWTDLTRLRQRRFWRHHPDRPTALAELVAPLRGPDVSTEEILGAHIARQSSAGMRNRLVNLALGVMLALSVGAFAFAEREATRANDAVNANAAHLLGATSHVVHQDDPATAQLLAVEAVHRLRDGQTRTALFNAVTANEPADPYLLRTVDVPDETGLADVAPTGTGVVGRTDNGDLVRWNPDDGAPAVLRGDRTPFGEVAGPGRRGPVVAGSSDGAVVAAVDDLGVTVGRFGPLPEGSTSRHTHLDLPGATAVAVTPEGDTLLVAWYDGTTGKNRIGSIGLTGRDLALLASGDGSALPSEQRLAFRSTVDTELSVTSLAVGSSRTVAVADAAAGTLEIRSLDSLGLARPDPVDLPDGAVPSPSLDDWATLSSGPDGTTVTVHHWADGSMRAADCPVPRAWSDPEIVAIDDGTTRALVATDDGLVACEISADAEVHRTWHLSGIRHTGPPVLVGVDRVAAASDGRIALWSTAGTRGDVPLPSAAGAAAAAREPGPKPVLATFRDASTQEASTAASWSDGTVTIHGLGTVTLPADTEDAGRPLLPVWLDRDRLLLITQAGDAYQTQGGTAAGYEAGFRDLIAPGLDRRGPECAKIVSAQRTRDDVLLVDACSGLHLLDAGLQERAVYVPGPLGEEPRLRPEWAEPGRVTVADDGSQVAVAPRDFSLRVADLAAAARGETDVWTVRGSSVAQVHMIGARSSAEDTSLPDELVTLGLDAKVRLRPVVGPGEPEGLDLTGTYGDVMAVLPGPDLVARNEGAALAFFDIRTGQKVGELATRLYSPGGEAAASDVHAADGQLLVVQDHGVTTGWTFSDDQMIARACAMAGRQPTPADMPDGVSLMPGRTCPPGSPR
ncbi:TIR domain-containing protein [Promicromonospora panici]|uniref:TIR domain-containing protein n=1 Tax=Promicromonospora panici TaxID=2219658 RepID=UPI00101BF526|nr:TIR domain-containing protein [Promicromonospora panici]